MKKQIVFVNQSSGYLMIDVIRALARDYDEVILCAGVVNARSRSLPSNVSLVKLAPYDRTSAFRRLWTWFKAFVKVWWVVATRYRKADLFLVSNPPFTVFLPRLLRNPFRMLVYDVYPDALAEYKMISRNSILYSLWAANNKIVFARASRIFTISEGMKALISAYTDEAKVEVVPLWAESSEDLALPRNENLFLKEHGLENSFVVMYSGNFGKTHPVELLAEVAEKVQDPGVTFAFIGGGEKFETLKKEITRRNLKNCLVLPWQPQEMLKHSISAADLSFVLLGKEAGNLSVPSKVFSLFSAGVPVLAVASKTSALGAMISSHGAGVVFDEEDTEGMATCIRELRNNRNLLTTMAVSSRKAAAAYTPENAAKMR